MIVLPKSSSDEEILNFVRAWVELLAQDRYEEACRMVALDAEHDWTPRSLQKWIAGYGSQEPFIFEDGAAAHVTSPQEARVSGGGPTHEIDWLDPHPDRDPHVLGIVHYDLPLNGEWSDLTALFEIVEVENGLILRLEDVHVL